MSKKIQTGLGKGLSALLPTNIKFSEKGFQFTSEEDQIEDSRLALIDLSKIENNPYQPRKSFDSQALEDLKNSILQNGVIQAITVRRSVSGYELISGERRVKASLAAGLKKIPAYILENISDYQMLEIALIENLQRENLNPIEIASGYQRLIEECNLTQEQVAEKVSKDRSTVTNFLRLLKLPEKIQESLRNKEISMGHAKALLGITDSVKLLESWEKVIQDELSVRATEILVRDIELGNSNKPITKKPTLFKNPNKPNVSPETSAVLKDTEDRLRHIFATNVKIQPKDEESGTIEIDFYSKDDFGRIIELFDEINSISN